ncbi:MAG TPA: type II secretion system protein [Methylibium sp.]|uniref:type II secretion system protein n=1 Tax=Methylibium sp. TaxID=2067992 RepID=UPI002DBC9414|nr:type II secretion system protein [Methylibium sp.]HEU4460131.1 type II secretion system protein [Methylibium sp.]
MRRRLQAPRGLTYLGLLFAVAAIALAGTATVRLGHARERQAAEDELLFAGDAYRQALRRWREAGATPGGEAGAAPRRLEDLLLDTRRLRPVRHLRRLYADPITGRADWVLIRDASGGIVGLHSRSRETPLRQRGFAPDDFHFAGKPHYSDWVFAWGLICTDAGCRLPGASLP